MGTPVRFAKGVLDEIRRAAAGSREEVCGLLFGTANRIDAALPCRNVAANPFVEFEIEPAQLLAAYRAARTGGPRIAGCYHSHPSGDAMPSVRDAAAAAANGWVWVIAGVAEARIFRAVENGAIHGRFDPVVMPALCRHPESQGAALVALDAGTSPA